MADTHVYKTDETVTATFTFEPDHAVPMQVWLYLSVQPAPGTMSGPPAEGRITYLTLQSTMAPSVAPAPPGEKRPPIITVAAVVPKYIVGGVYKPTGAILFMPDGSQQHVAVPDPDGDFERHIADDPPTTFETPVIKDLD